MPNRTMMTKSRVSAAESHASHTANKITHVPVGRHSVVSLPIT